MARRRRSFGVRSSRRVKWCGSGREDLDSGTFGLTSNTLCSEDEFEEFTGPTIVRLRGDFTARIGSTDSTVSQAIVIDWGIIVLDANATPPPDPAAAADADRPWLFLGSERLSTAGTLNTRFDSNGSFVGNTQVTRHAGDHYRRWMVDSKAMRKVRPGEYLALVKRITQATGSPTWRVGYNIRALVKE